VNHIVREKALEVAANAHYGSTAEVIVKAAKEYEQYLRNIGGSAEPSAPVVRDTGRRVFQCEERAADTVEIKTTGRHVQVSSNDGPRTANIYLTRDAAYELGAALFALADTLA
jgi:hypothetical protein